MEFSLPLPQTLAKDGILSRQWENFSYRFKCHKSSSLSQDPLMKMSSVLMYAAYQEVNAITEALKNFDIDLLKLNKIFEAIEQICLPRFILLFERFRYFTLEQDSSESMADFINVLRKQVELCEFGKIKDSIMTSALVNGATDESFKQSFLATDGLCFDDAVNMCSGGTASDKNAAGNYASKLKKANKRKAVPESSQNVDRNMYMMPLCDVYDDEDNVNDNIVRTVINVSKKEKVVKKQKISNLSNVSPADRPKLFLCFMCDNKYATRKSFRRHVANKHRSCQEYFCKHCDILFKSRTEMITHCNGHTSVPSDQAQSLAENADTGYQCWYCEETFSNLLDYKKHCLTHSAVRVFSCDLCQKKNHTIVRMIGHLKGHLSPKYRCPICANCFGRQELLEIHLQSHAAQPLHYCQVCSKGFVSADRLQGHMRTHTGEKRFTCELCGKSFSQKMSFDYHKRWHAGEMPYECEICGRKARSFGDLRKHKRLHSDRRPYVCEVCGKSFRYTSNLNRHRRGHSGKRCYECDICGRTFIYNEGLRDHIKAKRCPGMKNGDERVSKPRRSRAPAALNPQPQVETDYSPINYTTSHHAPEQLQHELPPPWQYMVRNEPDGAGGLVMMPPYY